MIDVLDGGFFTTVQDLGRYGYQRYGVPVSGAMDPFAFRVANLLVGNSPSAAALEMTLTGPRLRFLCDTVIAVTGADIGAQLDGQPLPRWQPVAAGDGGVLEFGTARDGLRAYLAISGGIDVPVVLGSRSTFAGAGLGGFQGRALRAGDCLSTCAGSLDRVEGRSFTSDQVPAYGHDHAVRVMLGPQDDAFTPEGIDAFLSATYVVTPKSDRVGCRLEGPRIAHKGSADIVSDGIPFGAIQVAGDGLPMILVADRGTTGGYTKVATVISADLPRVAQALPGDRISFRRVSLDEAYRAVQEEEAALQRISTAPPVVFARRRLAVSIDGTVHRVVLGLQAQVPSARPLDATGRQVVLVGEGISATVSIAVGAEPAGPE
jgi:antagonist of KipI